MSTDERLRAAGWEIAARPNDAEPTWTLFDFRHRVIVTLPQGEAEAALAKFDTDHSPKEGAAMRTIALAILFFIAGAAFALAKPNRPAEKKPEPMPVPELAMECHYGTIRQAGRFLILDGPHWAANGEIRKDGSVFMLWTDKSSGRAAPGVYAAERQADGKRALIGRWGWGEDVRLDEAGNLIGRSNSEHIGEVTRAP